MLGPVSGCSSSMYVSPTGVSAPIHVHSHAAPRTLASVRLDLNLEKGRIREEANAQELKIKETEMRIEQEVAVLRERLEQVKFSTLQWLV